MTALDLVCYWASAVYGIATAWVFVDWLEARRRARMTRETKLLASARVLRGWRR